ncbi:MAG TPA: cytochrome P450 [Candidatus Binatia bacterium]|jgi:cytochrome P450|nr:cytochrome P450 [Candidatus Binatia bacterium]
MPFAALPAVEPMPPRAASAVPWVRAGRRLLANPTAFFADTRRRLGDAYVVDAFGFRLFCVFSPMGVRALYALPEREASFGRATYELLSLKLPPELFAGRRVTPHKLFAGDDVERYLRTLDDAVSVELDVLGDAGQFEVFAEMRRLGHRLGFASWLGREAAQPRWLDRLIPLFDRIDSADAFVRPSGAFLTAATRFRRERRALAAIEATVRELWAERQRDGVVTGDFLEQIHAAYADVPPAARHAGVARDVVMLHLGSQSNLYAALAWTFINVVLRPELVARVRDGDDGLLERCASESIRLAQRSITLRRVMTPLTITLEDGRHHLAPGVLLATMLSVNNTTAAPGLDAFDPSHYEGRRLASDVPIAARELVSTFGHGVHACPAQRFAVSAIRVAVGRLLERFDVTPAFATALARPRQLGAVARAAHPCVVTYRRRVTA